MPTFVAIAESNLGTGATSGTEVSNLRRGSLKRGLEISDRFSRLALVLGHMLAKSDNGPVFFPNREFYVLVEALASREITGSEQLNGESRYLCKIAQNVLHIRLEAIVLRASRHASFDARGSVG